MELNRFPLDFIGFEWDSRERLAATSTTFKRLWSLVAGDVRELAILTAKQLREQVCAVVSGPILGPALQFHAFFWCGNVKSCEFH